MALPTIASHAALRGLAVCALALGVAAGARAQSFAEPFESFVVRNFRVEGAQRISEGTVYNYLPINIGDTITPQRVQEAIRALYSTGFFQDIELRVDGDTLVIAVLERPSIEEFKFSGNKDIPDEALESSLRDVGLARGKTFDRSVLDEVQRYLTEEYYARGKYGAKITPTVEELPDNRVRISLEIEEGERAKIRQINIVGNEAFDDKELLKEFKLTTGSLLSFIRDDNRYSREALEGDLETLRSYYMDRGYADFSLEDVRVAISPDRRDIFITIAVNEGDQYKFGEIDIAGKMVVPEAQLRALILPREGQMFSQQLLTLTEENMKTVHGFAGYAFAQVQAVPELDPETKTVDVTFFVDPQSRVYVRRINFNGADNVDDEVFRREMRQLEGAYLSNAALERSKVRLQRLPYVESVEYETVPVPGTSDLVDVEFDIEEGLPGQFGGQLGYAESQGVILGGEIIHSNFMGTGNRVALTARAGKYQKIYDFQLTDYYRSIDELSRTIQFTYQDITQFTSYTSHFSTETLSGGLAWQYPISEVQYLNFGFVYQDAELVAGLFSSDQAKQWVRENGDPFVVGEDAFGTNVRALEITAGWTYDSRNASIFPTAGQRIRARLNATVPGSEVEYYTASLDFTKFMPLWGRWIFKINSELAYGDAFGETTALPPFRNRYAGGPGSVRGYKQSYLGPRDNFGRPYGGNLLFANQFELIVPTPQKFGNSARMGLFFDIGNVFSTGGVDFRDRLGDPIDYKFDYDRLKKSVGFAVEWLSPMGLLSFSYAYPLNADEDTDRFYGDPVENFQFNIGSAF